MLAKNKVFKKLQEGKKTYILSLSLEDRERYSTIHNTECRHKLATPRPL